ncbi:MAG: HI1506-related protein [Methylobacter sp.]
MIRIRSLREGFRRGGVAHSVAPAEYPDNHFTADELEQLLFEPMLAVEVLDDYAAKLTVQQTRQAVIDWLDDVGNDDGAASADSSALVTDAAACADGIGQMQAVATAKVDIDSAIDGVIETRPDDADIGVQDQSESADLDPVSEAKPAKKPGK